MALCGMLLAIIVGCSQPSNTALLERGSYAMWQGRWSDASQIYQKATLQHPGDCEAQYNLGKCYMEMNEPMKACPALAVAESLAPNNNDISDLFAKALLESGQRDRLFSYLYQRAQEQQSVRDWLVFAEYTMDLDDPDSATNAINTAIAISNGTNAEPYIVGAAFAERLGDDSLAVARWREAWMIEPTNESVANALRAHGVVPGPTMTGVDDSAE